MLIFLCLCLRFSVVSSCLNVNNMTCYILTIKYIKASMCLYNWECDLFSQADTPSTTFADLMHTLLDALQSMLALIFCQRPHTHPVTGTAWGGNNHIRLWRSQPASDHFTQLNTETTSRGNNHAKPNPNVIPPHLPILSCKSAQRLNNLVVSENEICLHSLPVFNVRTVMMFTRLWMLSAH